VKPAISWAAVAVALGLCFAAGDATAERARVTLQDSVAAHGQHATRLLAELQHDGYSVEWQPAGAGSPCSDDLPQSAAPRPADARAGAWIGLEAAAVPDQLLLTICHLGAGGAPEHVSLRVPADDPQRLALAAVEALNGLAAKPRPKAALLSTPPLPEPRRAGSGVGVAALFASAALVVDASAGRPMVGASAGLAAPLSEPLSLELSAFVPFRQTTAQGVDRELSLGAAWARIGPRLAWVAAPLRLGLSLQGGPALIWASAETTPPLIGTTERTTSAMLSAGVWLECPDASTVHLRAAGRASRLVPSVELELGDGSRRSFGELLVEMDIGIGVRWDTAR
jgi:hypothetical protein